MNLDKELLMEIAKEVNDGARREAREQDHMRFQMFHGSTEAILKAAIAREYTQPETVNELSGRLIPINLFNKVTTKLAGLFTQPPIRQVVDENSSDTELMDLFVEKMCLNQRMKEANRYFKLFKRNLMELYVDEYGSPYVRNLPRHTYEVLSFKSLTPNRPDVVVKILHDDASAEEQVLSVWSDEAHFLINGKGEILADKMFAMDNIDGVNPYGKLPFIYINESSFSCDPIPDDDLFRMSIAIPLILTDICWATKYMSNSIIYTVGFEGTVPAAPNSVFNMPWNGEGSPPQLNQIKPEVDTDKVISMVQTLIALLLSTKSLSVNTVQTQLDASNAASGISKMLDSAESVEDKRDQQEYFENAERQMWKLLRDNLIPTWRKQNKLAAELNREFSRQFEVDIIFMEPKVLITESEQIDISKKRLDAGFSTLEMELKNIYPQKSQQQIDELADEIEEARAIRRQKEIEVAAGAVAKPDVEEAVA